jgi:cohesin complex subunit SA-1/2
LINSVRLIIPPLFPKMSSLAYLDKRISSAVPSSRGEDWQPLHSYRNSLVHGEADAPTTTTRRAYTRKRKAVPDEDDDEEDDDDFHQ